MQLGGSEKREKKLKLDFKNSFVAYGKSSHSRDFNKRQKLEELFETCTWDICSMNRKINPQVSLH